MRTDVIEGRRIQVQNQSYIEVRFTTRHDAVPFVTTTLEHDGTQGAANNAYVVWTTQTHTRIQFSANFSGYLHLQAFSKMVP